MPNQKISEAKCRLACELIQRHDGIVSRAAAAEGISEKTLSSQKQATKAYYPHLVDEFPDVFGERGMRRKPFTVPALPDPEMPVSELIEARKRQFARRMDAHKARKLINVNVETDGPIGVAHFGDPHVDDDGCDIAALEHDLHVVNRTDGMFAANLGDVSNNWIGRLAHLYAQQGTTANQAWMLVEWLMKSCDWLYLVGGNHDAWSGSGDPLKWIMAGQAGLYEAWGVRIALKFPNGKELRINARHDFSGHSMWNPNHGPMKAVQGGWRDHILTCGHKHVSFIAGPLKDPSHGLLSWAIRCAGYKVIDGYATEKGLPDQNAFPTAVTVIDPRFPDDDPRLVTVFASVDEGADYLKFKRKRK